MSNLSLSWNCCTRSLSHSQCHTHMRMHAHALAHTHTKPSSSKTLIFLVCLLFHIELYLQTESKKWINGFSSFCWNDRTWRRPHKTIYGRTCSLHLALTWDYLTQLFCIQTCFEPLRGKSKKLAQATQPLPGSTGRCPPSIFLTHSNSRNFQIFFYAINKFFFFDSTISLRRPSESGLRWEVRECMCACVRACVHVW